MEEYEAAKAIIKHEEKILVVRCPKSKLYDFPGGKLEQGEDYLTALKREVFEETGLILTDIQTSHIYEVSWIDYHERKIHSKYFVASTNTADITLSEENDDAQWINPKDTDLELYPETRDAIKTLSSVQ